MLAARDVFSVRRYGASPGSHVHDHFQVLLGLEGTLELEVEGRGQRVGRGEGWVIAPGQRHDFEARQTSQCLVLDTTSAAWAHCPGQPLQPEAARALGAYLNLSLAQPNPVVARYAGLLMLDCWRPPVPTPLRSQRRIDWPTLERWVHANLHEPLTVADLAGQVFLSPTQFGTRIRRETGLSAMQWVRQLRTLHARALRQSGTSALDAALQCGYRSAAALAHASRVQKLG